MFSVIMFSLGPFSFSSTTNGPKGWYNGSDGPFYTLLPKLSFIGSQRFLLSCSLIESLYDKLSPNKTDSTSQGV